MPLHPTHQNQGRHSVRLFLHEPFILVVGLVPFLVLLSRRAVLLLACVYDMTAVIPCLLFGQSTKSCGVGGVLAARGDRSLNRVENSFVCER